MGTIYSAAIIGAGSAGCAAAIALARSGLKVLLIAAFPHPQHRPGESLHPDVEPIFEALGVAEAMKRAQLSYNSELSFRPAPSVPQVTEPSNKAVEGDWQGYRAWRPALDRVLLAEAIAQGVEVWQPCRVHAAILEHGQPMGITTDRGIVRAYYFLDASGQCQWLSQQLGIATTARSPRLLARFGYVAYAETMGRSLPEDPISLNTPIVRQETDGWSWITRIAADRCAWSRMKLGDAVLGNTIASTVSALQGWQPLELADFEPVGETKGADVTWRISDRPAGSGWFLLGEAAAVLASAASHGIVRSLKSGIQAAHVIAACEQGDITETIAAECYAGWLRAEFDRDVAQLKARYQKGQSQWRQQFEQWAIAHQLPEPSTEKITQNRRRSDRRLANRLPEACSSGFNRFQLNPSTLRLH